MTINYFRETSYANIMITESVLRYVQAHALSFPKVEIAGVLVGPYPKKLPNNSYKVFVRGAIAGKYLRSSSGSVQLSADTWSYFNQVMVTRFPDEEVIIVGWYHTHPQMRIFFSEADIFVHQTCFTQAFHVAMVLDPHQPLSSSRFFGWDENTKIVEKFFSWPQWVDDW